MSWKPDIFSYVDYRAYLRAYYDAAKESLPKFSYRAFAEKAGLSSQSFLRDVMRGDKNIGGSVAQFCRAMDLSKSERVFFALLVAFEQAEGRQERNRLFEEIAAKKRFREASRIDEGMYRYLSHWYYPAIRELAAHDDFRDDAKWIAAQLRPAVTVREVKQALAMLVDLGFLVREEDGLSIGEPSLTTGHEVASLGVANYHHEMLRLAGESIERFPSEHRSLGAMTICVNDDEIDEIKTKIQSIREQILALSDAKPGGTVVLQFNTQLFPMTKVES